MHIAGPLQIELLPRAAYSASDTADGCVLGIALEPQSGVHAIGSDRRKDFHSRFGELSFKPAGMTVVSESAEGGEYLLVRSGATEAGLMADRPQWLADRNTLTCALRLRSVLSGGASPERLSCDVQRFVCHAWAAAGKPESVNGKLRRAYDPVVLWIESALEDGRNEDLRLEVLADLARQGVFQFLRGFSEAFGLTPHAFVAEWRLQRARRIAKDPSVSLAEAAAAAGYASQSHMGASFKRALGLTPLRWRELASRASVAHSG